MFVGLLLVGAAVARIGQGVAPAAADVVSAKPATPTSVSPTTPRGRSTPSGTASSRPTSLASSTSAPASPYLKPVPGTIVAVPNIASGKTRVVPVPTSTPPATGRTFTYTVEVEVGLPVDAAAFAAAVQKTLTDQRGWQGVDGVRFVNISPDQAARGVRPNVRVTLASPELTNRFCAPQNTGLSKLSCFNGERATINFHRWINGATTYGKDIASYRQYVVNHEVGHSLGHGHVGCPSPGERAPLMVQQTKWLLGCTPWPWPQRT